MPCITLPPLLFIFMKSKPLSNCFEIEDFLEKNYKNKIQMICIPPFKDKVRSETIPKLVSTEMYMMHFKKRTVTKNMLSDF